MDDRNDLTREQQLDADILRAMRCMSAVFVLGSNKSIYGKRAKNNLTLPGFIIFIIKLISREVTQLRFIKKLNWLFLTALLFTSCYYEASEYPDLFDCDEARSVYVLENISGIPLVPNPANNCFDTDENLNLTATGAKETTITWESANESVISTNGTVVRGAVDQYVEITATFSKNNYGVTRTWNIRVLAL